jgi:hypothetical protein
LRTSRARRIDPCAVIAVSITPIPYARRYANPFSVAGLDG